MTRPETITVETSKFACNGDKDSAHPRVFLVINAEGFVDCPYCSKHYILDTHASHHDAH